MILRNMHDEDLCIWILFYQIKKDKVDGACREPGRVEKCNTVLVGKTEKKRLFEWPECKWKDNIKTEVEEVKSQGVDDNHAEQVTVWGLGIYEHINANLGSIKWNFPNTGQNVCE